MIARPAAAIFCATLSAAASAQDAPAYIGSARCADCHEEAARAWTGSHHQLAWTWPGPDTVIADFDGTRFAGAGTAVAFSEDESGYHAEVTEADGSVAEYDVHSVIGIAPLQQYLFETAPGRLQSFDVVWDAEKEGWYHLYPDQALPPDDGLHWTGPYKNWNGRCAECHATGFEKNYDPATESFASTQVEIGVGCEACHGPGAAHLEWATTRTPVESDMLDGYGFTMATEAGAEAWIQQCAGCHSRREPYGEGNPLPGTPYHDAYRLTPLMPGLYWPDGQIRDEVYVYGSFLQSKMYAKGVSCMNCHDAHSATLVAEGNAVCTQCHSPAGNPDFPSLPLAEFDAPSHHFHEPGSPGAECRNCHMAEQVYMGIDARADHSFRIPRPDLAAKSGAPDACTACHADQSAEWAAARIAEWYPQSTRRGAHFGTVFARAQTDPFGARRDLTVLARDKDLQGIVRATALYLMGPAADPAMAASTAPLLADPDPMVRAGAVPLQGAAPPQEAIFEVAPLLDDPSRTVRFAALRAMLGLPIAHLPPEMASDRDRVMADWQGSLSNRLDFPETHLVLGGIALTQRNFPAALAGFREAVALDPQQQDAWSMVIRLTEAMEGPEAARAAAREALAANPGAPALADLALRLGMQADGNE